MTKQERMARALGLSMNLIAFGQDKVVNGRQESTGRYDPKKVKRYLASAEGERAVRDKVREKWCRGNIDFQCPDYQNIEVWVDADGYELVLESRVDGVKTAAFDAVTEHEVYCAALLWIDKGEE